MTALCLWQWATMSPIAWQLQHLICASAEHQAVPGLAPLVK